MVWFDHDALGDVLPDSWGGDGASPVDRAVLEPLAQLLYSDFASLLQDTFGRNDWP